MLIQVDSAGERGSVLVARADKTTHSASNNFLECWSSWSNWVSSLLAVKLWVSHWLSERLSEAQSLSMRCGRAPGSDNNPSSWIHRGYICPTEDLTLNLPGAFCCWIKALTHLKVDSVSAPAHSAVLNTPISGKGVPYWTGVAYWNTTMTESFPKTSLSTLMTGIITL